MKEIVFASQNEGKIEEFKEILNDLPVLIHTLKDFNLTQAEEVGLSFIENALIKARALVKQINLPVIADDSGLVVEALDGAPGIYSSRFAGEGATDMDNRKKLINLLKEKGIHRSKAYYYCATVFMNRYNEPAPIVGEGKWEGEIIPSCHGNKGFGFDPMFYLPEHSCTVAELDPILKNRLSHRFRALDQIRPHILRWVKLSHKH